MRWYEITTGIHRKRPGYTGLIAIICLFASMFLAWAVTGMGSDENEHCEDRP